jgi:hypothetical protein
MFNFYPVEIRLRQFLFIPAIALLAGCVSPPLTEYRPVVDPAKSNPAKFERDLVACRYVGISAEAGYKKRQEEEMARNMVAGILVGAVLGAAIGDSSDYAAAGAVYGAGVGAASTDTELANGGPRRIIDRCMADRGHTILNDLGKG